MTATEELRRMLDERGVEWWEGDDERKTHWRSNGLTWEYFNDENGDAWLGFLGACENDVTPEQAIDATLGRGECKIDVLNTGDCAGYECSEYIMHCNGCGHEFGHVLYNEDGDVWMSERPNFCPNCGAKVVDPTTNDVDAEVDA